MTAASRLGASALLAALILAGPLTSSTPAAEPAIDYNRDVRPILSDNCFHCHGPDASHREAELRLDTEAGQRADLGGYRAVEPGKPQASALVARITSRDVDERMPPAETEKQLSEAQIDMLRRWIAEGGKWSKAWAYVPPRRHELPEATKGGPGQGEPKEGWIDQWLAQSWSEHKLEPVGLADRVTLIRRLYFDLLGLPPSPEEVDAFVKDQRPQAYDVLVDRLLASPHFGERMAIYWLDLVRFADTVGYHGDQDHNISPYRDYVIDAFNLNMPLDQFTREQLAGDLLEGSTVDQKIATGYNRLLQTSHEGGVQPKEYLAIYAADRVRNLSAVWLGGTLGCAQCHDHKYDPYTSRDFYAMQAFFADVDEAQHFRGGTNGLPTKRAPELAVHTRREREQLAEWSRRIEQLKAGEAEGPEAADAQAELQRLQQQHDRLAKAQRKTMITVAIEPRTIRILPRGNWLDESGPIVAPAVPAFLGALDTGERRPTRLDLANWLTDREHGIGGLTARVFANRFWYLLFGRGLAPVLDDFGGQGEPPAHPQLLDNLAVEFLESGWNVKQMMRMLVMSDAYRRSSVPTAELARKDPENRWFARQSRFRLPAESIRDTALSIGGLLVNEFGGASVRPYQPAGYYRHLNFPRRKYEHDQDQRQWRRGVYVHWQRQFLHPTFRALDAPSREECTAQRPRSNTPNAALALLNDPTFVEAARALAQQMLADDSLSPTQRQVAAFRRVVSRPPNSAERELMASYLARMQSHYKEHPEEAAKLLQVGMHPLDESLDADALAAWTMLGRALLNMSETITRN